MEMITYLSLKMMILNNELIDSLILIFQYLAAAESKTNLNFDEYTSNSNHLGYRLLNCSYNWNYSASQKFGKYVNELICCGKTFLSDNKKADIILIENLHSFSNVEVNNSVVNLSLLNEKQQQTYDIIIKHVTFLTDKTIGNVIQIWLTEPLNMIIASTAGTGKSF